VEDARVRTRTWLRYYNTERRHTQIGYRTPQRYFEEAASASPSPLGLCPQTPRIYRMRPIQRGAKRTRRNATPRLILPYSAPPRRSGRFPALPYPPGGQTLLYQRQTHDSNCSSKPGDSLIRTRTSRATEVGIAQGMARR
jgi:hypothetical protein